MERVYLVGVVACLGVSWIYILFLKVQIRDCVTYIQNRMTRVNLGVGSASGSREVEHESKGTSSPGRPRFKGTTLSALERATMDEKPRLIVGISEGLLPLHYVCSHCLLPFNLSGDQPPKEAVEELLLTFGEHVEHVHPSAAPATISSSEVPGQSPGSGIKPLRILLAEENPISQLLAVRLLEKHGHKVVRAHNGREVLGRIEKEYFDLVLIDLELPGLDGLRTTLEIRKNEQATGFHLPVVTICAFPKEGDRERCRAAGMDGFLSKPFNYKEFRAVVQSVLGSPKTASESDNVVHQ
jgi:CheY-like chemotaxis protein